MRNKSVIPKLTDPDFSHLFFYQGVNLLQHSFTGKLIGKIRINLKEKRKEKTCFPTRYLFFYEKGG